jgi:tetratricopeptide (TPR) repeat protein
VAESSSLFVCRPSDLDAMRGHLDAARNGTSRTVLLEAPFGGGKRAVVGELVRGLPNDEDHLVLRAALSDEEDGLRTLLRLYAALYGALNRDLVLRGKVEMILNAQLPQHGKRVQGWYQAFVEGLKKAVPNENEQTFQVTLPRDNPFIGFVEILSGISRKMTTVFEVQNAFNSNSVSTFAALEALHDARRQQGKLLLVLGTEPIDEVSRTWMPAPFLDFIDRRGAELQRHVIVPWGADEVSAYLASKDLSAAAPGRIGEIALGRPAYIAELVDVLVERNRLGESLDGVTLQDLAPLATTDGEIEDEAPTPVEGQRRPAVLQDVPRVQFLAALLGLSFPSGLVADMDGLDRDSVDDLFDALPDLVAELQFSKGLGTWIYQFKRGLWRQAILDAHVTEEDHDLARRVAAFLERFLVPRGYEFMVKTLRMFGEHGAPQRAGVLRSVALGNDRPDVWAMTQDLLKYFEAVEWPDPMRRTVFMNLADRMVQNGDVEQAEKLLTDAMAWATGKSDRMMEAWMLFAGSRLDFRRSDLYRARDRAKDALKLYGALGDKMKQAELQNHLAMIEYTDGNNNASLDHLRQALETANVPPVQANAEYIRGLIARKARKLPEAAEHFRQSNELAGGVGLAALALEAGFHYGEALLMSNQTSKAADVLQRVAQIAQALQNPVRERATVALLAQAHGILHNYEAALTMANRTLQLTQELKFDRFVPLDIYNVAYFNLQLGRATEALSLFAKARERAPADDSNFLRELHFHTGMASLRIGEKSTAAGSFREALPHAQKTKDFRKVMLASEHLANIALDRGDKPAAARLLNDAIKAAEAGDLREERKGLRRKLEELER